MYGTNLTLAAAALLAYVLWRASSVPGLRRVPRRLFPLAGLLLALLLFAGRWLGHDASGPLGTGMEFASMTLAGFLLLVTVCLFPVDLATGFGFFFPRHAPRVRGWALLAGCLLALFALFQGLRPPVVIPHEVALPGLPPALDRTRVAAISDLHLGALIGPGWLRGRVAQVQELRPDLILLLGDIFEGHGGAIEGFLPPLQRLAAPLGVWAVEGNHDRHGGSGGGRDPRSEFSWRTLRDEVAQLAPGLFLAGRRHLSRRERRQGMGAWNPDGKRYPGGLVLMSHAPEAADAASRAGVGLMLSGHTHGGQIWPLSHITRRLNPLLAGRYEIGKMTVLVSRGAGTWGPRMRLWPPGDILLVTLRAPGATAGGARGRP